MSMSMLMRMMAVVLTIAGLAGAGRADTYGRYTIVGTYLTDASDGAAGLYFQTIAEQGSTKAEYAVIGCVYPVRTCTAATGDLVIPETLNGVPVRKIQAGAFVANNNLKSVVLPANLREIGVKAFASCMSLTNVTCSGSGLASIGECCFSNCYSLANMTLPASLQRIGRNAFVLCDNLAWVHFKGHAPMLDEVPTDAQASYFGEKRWTSGTAPARTLFYVERGTYGWNGPYRLGLPDKWPLACGYMNAHPIAYWPESKQGLSVHIGMAD